MRRVRAALRGGLGDLFVRLLGPGLLERVDTRVEPAAHKSGADQTAEKRTDETERDDAGDPGAFAAFFPLLGFFRLGRGVVARRDRTLARRRIMSVRIDALFFKAACVAVFAFGPLFGAVVSVFRLVHGDCLFLLGWERTSLVLTASSYRRFMTVS